jgi:hypothetical protein
MAYENVLQNDITLDVEKDVCCTGLILQLQLMVVIHVIEQI